MCIALCMDDIGLQFSVYIVFVNLFSLIFYSLFNMAITSLQGSFPNANMTMTAYTRHVSCLFEQS